MNNNYKKIKTSSMYGTFGICNTDEKATEQYIINSTINYKKIEEIKDNYNIPNVMETCKKIIDDIEYHQKTYVIDSLANLYESLEQSHGLLLIREPEFMKNIDIDEARYILPDIFNKYSNTIKNVLLGNRYNSENYTKPFPNNIIFSDYNQ